MSGTEQSVELQTAKTSMNSKEVIAYLAEKFPLCFSVEGTAKPLKIGLFQELATALENDEKVSKTALRQALRSYTMGWRYLEACVTDAVRVDLAGNPAGTVDAMQAEHAAQSLAEAKAAYAARRQAERKANQQNIKPKTREVREQNSQKRVEVKAKRKPQNVTVVVKKSRVEKIDIEQLIPLAIENVTKGQKIKVKIGSHAQNATVLDIERQAVRVQLVSGLTMNVSADKLFA